MKRILPFSLLILMCGVLWAQEPESAPVTMQSPAVEQSPDVPVTPMAETPIFRVQVVSRSTQAVNYRHHSGKTYVDFHGTSLDPEGKGRARVESRTGRIEIGVDFEHLPKASTYGPEYLTYVLWAITPEGRAANLGEVVPKDGKSEITVSTTLQAFGMIVTAEPYFAVTRPSDRVVLENVIRKDTKGWEEPIDTKFDVLERGEYTLDVKPEQLPSMTADAKTPVNLLEARNAVAIAKAAQAERYAPDVLRKAEDFLARGEDYLVRKQGEKAIGTVTRGAVQAAEDARLISIRRKREEDEAAKRHALEQQTADAQARATSEAEQRAQADRDRQSADEQRRLAEQARLDAEQARQQAEAAKADAEAARQQALAQQQSAEAEAERARQAASQAEQDKEQTRQRLLAQLNQVLQTRESARGLIVSMPDVLFDFNKYTLKAGARERLAKVAGILQAYPGLRVQIEGHTDNVGSEEYNQKLSEERANSVREFLVSQGVPSGSVTERGLGENDPVATNATAAGRQLNRRVDMVVNGEAIGGAGTSGAANTVAPGPNQPAMPITNQPGTPMNTQPGTEIPH